MKIQLAIRRASRAVLAASVLAGASLAAPTPQNCPNWQPGYGLPGLGADGSVQALEVLDFGNGPQLYAGGSFQQIGGVTNTRAARFDGTTWHALSGALGPVFAFERFHDGVSPALYAATDLSVLQRYDGANFQTLATVTGGDIFALKSFDDGSGEALYAGGDFNVSPGLPQRYLGKWNGSSWAPFPHAPNNDVYCFADFDDGSGPALYMGGAFTSIGGAPMSRIARWNGSQWTQVGGGFNGSVFELEVADLGGGPRLFAVGSFTNAGGAPALNVASWDGVGWSAIGAGVAGARCVGVFDAGAGPQLWVGGSTQPITNTRLSRWDGANWITVEGGASPGFVLELEAAPTAAGESLFAGGIFSTLAGQTSSNLAELRACVEPGVAYCFGDGSGTACACNNQSAPGAGQGCTNSTGVGARLEASGSTSVSINDQAFEISGLPPGKSGLLFAGDARSNQGLGLPFDDGLRCAGGALRRFPIQVAPPSGVVTYGPGLAAQGGFLSGDTRNFQAWYRDPSGPCSRGSNLSNGYEIVFTP